VRVRHFLLLPIFLCVACSDSKLLPSYDLAGNTMGTSFNITLVDPPPELDLDQLDTAIREILENVENIASTYRDDSELSRFNVDPSTEWIRVNPEFCRMVSAANDISLMTQGAFDITVGPLVNLWGFGPGHPENEIPTDEEIAAAKMQVGFEALKTDCDHNLMRKSSADVYVDLSGWAKGYAVDQVANLLDARKLTDYLVEIGGELKIRGHNAQQQKFSIAIEKPLPNNEMAYTLLRLSDVSVATSGDYRNYFEHEGRRYSHSIDPRTGHPVSDELAGVTVVSTNTAYADAMATAFLVLGFEDGLALAEKRRIAAYFLLRTDNGVDEKSSSQFELLERE
jgi:thiamine biosynthesis lipoprotein